MSEIAMSRDQYRVAYEDDADNVRGKPFTLPAGDANHSDVITGVSSPSTFAEAFAAAPASCPGCERSRSVAVGLQGEVERLTATLSRVEGRVRMLVDEVEDECVRDYGAGVCVTHGCDLVPIKGRMTCALIADLDSLISDFQALNGEFRTLAAEEASA